ncbi:MAG: APC family permease [Spirochaetales bacterium]
MELKKDAISLNSVIIYSISAAAPAMCIGGSMGFIMGGVGLAVPLAFLIATVVVVLISASYSQLSERYNSAGGTYSYIRRVFGPEMGWWVGWIYIGITFTVGCVGAIFAIYLCSLFTPLPLWLGIILIAIPTFYVGWKGIQLTTKGLVILWLVQTALMVWPAIAAFNSQAPSLPDVGKQLFASSWIPSLGSKGLAMAVLLCIWSYVGFETPAYLGEEIKGGSKAVKIAISVGSVAIGITYIVVTWLWVSSISAENLAKISGSGTAIFDYCTLINYPLGRWLITISVCMSCLACWFSFVTALPRMLYDMGRTKALPKSFAKLNRHSAPSVGLIVTMILWLGAALFGAYFSVDTLFSLMSSFACIAYALVCAAAIKDRWGGKGLKSFFIDKAIPILAIGIMLWMLSSMSAGYLVAVGAWALVGVVIIVVIRLRKGRDFFKQVEL